MRSAAVSLKWRFSEIAPAGSLASSKSSPSSTDQTPGPSAVSPFAACTAGAARTSASTTRNSGQIVSILSRTVIPSSLIGTLLPRFPVVPRSGVKSRARLRPCAALHVLRLVQLQREPTRNLEVRDEAVPAIRDLVHELDALRP